MVPNLDAKGEPIVGNLEGRFPGNEAADLATVLADPAFPDNPDFTCYGNEWEFNQVKEFEKSDFRSLYAFDEKKAIIANAGSPANILITEDGGLSWNEIYKNEHADIFLDGIDFWNENEGVIYGDPIEGRMTLLFTMDGGKTWIDGDLESRPEMTEGEASFAASGTGIRCTGISTLTITSGGKKSRIFRSKSERLW